MDGKMIYIVADDLTGANDTAIQYRKNGLRAATQVRFIPEALPALRTNCGVISINVNSRAMAPGEAYRANFRVAEAIRSDARYIYKKIDSVFRGNIVPELEAIMDAAQSRLCLLAPAYPENHRTCVGGIVYVNGEELLDAGEYLRASLGCRLALLPVDVLRRGGEVVAAYLAEKESEGASVFLCDSADAGDLHILASAVQGMENVLFSGSAGFAASLSELCAGEEAPFRCPEETGRVLVVIGTRHAETAAQVKRLQSAAAYPVVCTRACELAAGDGTVQTAYARRVSELFREGNDVVVLLIDSLLLESDGGTLDAETSKLAESLGCITQQVLRLSPVDAMILSGGDTAFAVCLVNSINTLWPETEIGKGIPVCGAEVNGEPLLLVTKSGGFGDADALLRALCFLQPQPVR